MSYIAVEKVSEAFDRAKESLLPFSFWDWMRFTLIVLFVGGSGFNFFGNVPSSGFDDGSSYDSYETYGSDYSQYSSGIEDTFTQGGITGLATGSETATVLGAVTLVAALILGFFYLGAIFEFIMFQSIRDKKPRIRANFRKHMGNALKYMLYQLSVLVVLGGLVIGIAALITVNPLFLLALLVLLPLLVAFAVFDGIVHDLTLQGMISEKKGFIASVKDSLGMVNRQREEFLVYMLTRFGLTFIQSILDLFIMLMVGLPIFLFVIIVSALLIEASMVAGVVFGVLTGLIGLLVLSAVRVPLRVFMYSYYVEVYEGFKQ